MKKSENEVTKPCVPFILLMNRVNDQGMEGLKKVYPCTSGISHISVFEKAHLSQKF